jgi:hypothetical protein
MWLFGAIVVVLLAVAFVWARNWIENGDDDEKSWSEAVPVWFFVCDGRVFVF